MSAMRQDLVPGTLIEAKKSHGRQPVVDRLPCSSMSDSKTYTFYFGGELFSGKHLLGNAVLAEAVFNRSKGVYRAVLPQNLEQRDTTPHAIRDQDIRALLACDLGLFHYDGPELDSGTVVEFMFAKFADIPSVLVRTDFRNGGDQAGVGDPWNLMSSYFPRTTNVVLDAMSLYQQGLAAVSSENSGREDALENHRSGSAGQTMIGRIADAIIKAFNQMVVLPPVMPSASQETIYQWLALMPGFKAGSEAILGEVEELRARKQAKGLL